MLRASVTAFAALHLSAALRHQTPAEPLPEAQECPETRAMLDGKGGCMDEQHHPVPMTCCTQSSVACKEEVNRLSLQCSLRIQAFMQGCQLLPGDIGGSGASLEISDSSRLCSEECLTYEALIASDPLANLDVLRSQCAEQLAPTMAIVTTVENFHASWAACKHFEAATAHPAVLDVVAPDLIVPEGEVHDGDSTLTSSTTPLLARTVRWGNVNIMTKSVFPGEPATNLRGLFETVWSTIPVTYSEEFRITGTFGAIQEELLLRPELPVSCPAMAARGPVHLVVQRLRRSGGRMSLDAFGKGFANIAGLGTVAAQAPDRLQVGGEGRLVEGLLAGNPTQVSLEVAVNYWMDRVKFTPTKTLRKFWRWISGTRESAFLTLADPERKRHVGSVVRFQCAEVAAADGSRKAFATWVDGEDRTVVTAKHLAFLITALA